VKRYLYTIICIILLGNNLFAQATFSAGVYTQDFGTANIPSWTDNSTYTGWYIYPTSVFVNNTVNITAAAPTNTGGIYTYMCNGNNDIKLGTRPSDSKVTSGTFCPPPCNYPPPPADCFFFGLELQNNTGTTINSITVSFDWFQLSESEDGGVINTNFFEYQVGAVENNVAAAAGWTHVAALDFTGPDVYGSGCCAQIQGDPCNMTGNNSTCIDLSGTPILPGQEIMLRWTDPNNDHNDPHMAIDNVSVTVNTVSILSSSPTICSGNSTTLTASGGATSYTWAPGTGLSATTGSSVTASPAASTTYTITGAFPGGCNATQTVVVTVNATPTVSASAASPTICSSNSTSLNASGATTYTWSPNTNLSATTGSSVTANPSSTITYTVTGDAGGCTSAPQTVVVTVNPTPSITASSTSPAICSGNSDGLNAIGATSYTWSPNTNLSATTGAGVTATPSSTITYTVTGTTAGCTSAPQTLVITVNTTPTVSASASSPTICSGNSTTLNASGATTYAWSPGTALSATTGASITASPTANITYTITGTTAGCTSPPFTVSVTVNTTPTVTASAVPPTICSGTSTTLSSSGAATYTWSPNTNLSATTGVSVTASPNSTTTYTVTGTTLGCPSAPQTVVVNVNPTPTISASAASPTICSGNSTSLNASGATTYNWSPNTNLSATTGASVTASPGSTITYTVTGTTTGCTSAAQTVIVTVNATPTVIASAAPPAICSGNSTTLTASGAASYTWSPNTNLSATTGSPVTANPGSTITYTVTGTTLACPSAPQTVVVTVNTTPTVSIALTGISPTICAGDTIGMIASGATTYTWSPSTGLNITTGAYVIAKPGTTQTYTVTGTAAGGCTGNASQQITVNPVPSVTVTPSSATICSGNSTSLTASGGISYTWAPGGGLSATTGATVNANPGVTQTYSVVGKNGSGCKDTVPVVVTVNPTPTISASASSPTICSGNSTSLNASGATTYNWSPNANLSATTGASVTASPPVTTTYTVTGSTGACTSAPQMVVVTVNPTPTVTTSAPPTICSGNSTTITASGGTTYSWSTGATTSSILVNPGVTTTYTVTGTTTGCPSAPKTIVVTVNPTPTVTASALPPTICSGSSSTLTANGATTYLWNTGATTSAITVNPGGTTTYTVTGTSAGCPSTPQTVIVTVNPTPTISISPLAPTICPGGNVNLTVIGATTYTWSPATDLSATTGATVNATPTITATYTVTGTSAAGCPSAPQTVVVKVASTLNVSVTPGTPSICSGDSIILNASGAATYTWKPGTGLSCTNCPNPTALPGTTVTYTVNGASGACTDSANVTLVVNPTPTVSISITGISSSICPTDTMGMVASGATSYTWSPSAGLNVTTGVHVIASPAVTTTYTVTGNSAGGCSSIATMVITVYPQPVISISLAKSTICQGDTVQLNASGGATYTWAPGTGLNTTIGAIVIANPSITATYTVNAKGVGGCPAKDSVVITVLPKPNVTVTPPIPAVCKGDSVVLTANGAASYTWSPSTGLTNTAGSATTAFPGATSTYTVIGKSAGGCNDTITTTVTVNPLPVITVTPPTPAICSGDSIMLAAGGGATYVWSPSTGLSSTTGANVTAKPAGTSTYSVTGTDINGCISNTSVSISVGTLTVTVNASSTTICSGNSSTLTASGAVTYVWKPATGLSATTGTSVTATPTTSVTYTVVGSSGGGCADSNTVNITVNPTPTVSISPISPLLCAGDSIALSAGGATTYSWTPTTGLSCTSCPNPNASPGSTTTYTVSGLTGGCSSISMVTVTVGNINVTGTPVKPALCTGDSTVINASGGASYTWFPSTGLSATTGSSVTAIPATTTTYTLVGASVAGCTDTIKVIVTVNSLPVVSVSATDTNLCTGNSATITASGASTYTWLPATGLTPSTGAVVVANPPSTQTYTVTGTSATGCSSTAQVTIHVNSSPSVSINLSGGDTLCPGQTVIMTGNGATTYAWSPATGLSSTNGASVTVSPTTSPVVYTVVGSNGTCSDSAKQTIYLYQPLVVIATPDTICAGRIASVSVSASGGKQGYAYSWIPSLGSGPGPYVVNPASSTTYSCQVTDGCGSIATGSIPVIVFPSPKAIFYPTPDSVLGGQYVAFVDSSKNATSWYWTFGDGGNSTNAFPFYQYLEQGNYLVTLVVSNALGCSDTSRDTVYVTEGLFVPNVFTPNGDGMNDGFHVSAAGLKTFSIEIFNRWGERVFISNSPDIDWDGRSTTGVQESDGDYYYIIRATDYKGKPFNQNGYVQLIRN